MYSTALEIYDEIIPQLIKLHGEKSVKVGNALYLKAAVYYGYENYSFALNHFQKAVEIVAAVLPKGDSHINNFVHNYATALNRCKKYIPAALFQKHLRFIDTKYRDYFR
jgi:tetratricopeptide (TPR) repeat protein